MSVRTEINRLLSSDAVAGIDFDLNGLYISGAGFARVGQLIADGHIGIHIDADLCAGAQYEPSSYGDSGQYDTPNFLTLRSAQISDRYVQAYVVHEATHALCDLMRARGYVYVEEAAAFLAEVIFARRLDPPLNLRRWPRRRRLPTACRRQRVTVRREVNRMRRESGRPTIPRDRPFNHGAQRRIHAAAQALVDRYDLDERPSERRPRLPEAAFAALRDAVASTETYEYIHRPDTPGGPPHRYQNDGVPNNPNAASAPDYEAF